MTLFSLVSMTRFSLVSGLVSIEVREARLVFAIVRDDAVYFS
jgi:hypothetical protein